MKLPLRCLAGLVFATLCLAPPAGSGTIRGHVTADCPSPTTPLAGIQVDLYPYFESALLASTTTDAAGAYAFSGLTNIGAYLVVAHVGSYPATCLFRPELAGTTCWPVTLFTSDGESVQDLAVTCPMLRGFVGNTDAILECFPIGGVPVQVFSGAVPVANLVSDAFGNFEAKLPPGEYRVAIAPPPDHTAATTETTLTIGPADGFARFCMRSFPHLAGVMGRTCDGLECFPYGGIVVDVFSGTGDLVRSVVTDDFGNFDLQLAPGAYSVSAVLPLGYLGSPGEASVTLGSNNAFVNLCATCIPATGKPRAVGYWKHQIGVATGGPGTGQLDATRLCAALDQVQTHFNNNSLNQVVIYSAPTGTACPDKLEIAAALLNLSGGQSDAAKARAHLLALLLNVAVNNLGLQDVISKDGATVTQAITYCDNVLDNPSGNASLAGDIADRVNSGQKVAAGLIPLNTQSIVYARGARSLDFSVSPNPAGGARTFEFALDQTARVQLEVFDLGGRRLARLVDRPFGMGRHEIPWNGRLDRGEPLPQGVYFARLTVGAGSRIVRLVQAAP